LYLTRLTFNPRSPEFRRDMANVHDMHRTVMSAYPEEPATANYRQHHGVLWRVDRVNRGYVQYVQSRSKPDWSRLPPAHLLRPAEVRSLQPLLDGITAGRRYAFRLVGNPTRCVHPKHGSPKRVPHRLPEKQIGWLVEKGRRHGFIVPTTDRAIPDVIVTPMPDLIGRRQRHIITIAPVRFDGHLIVTDPEAFARAVVDGIGRAKAYGCGLLSLAPARTAQYDSRGC